MCTGEGDLDMLCPTERGTLGDSFGQALSDNGKFDKFLNAKTHDFYLKEILETDESIK